MMESAENPGAGAVRPVLCGPAQYILDIHRYFLDRFIEPQVLVPFLERADFIFRPPGLKETVYAFCVALCEQVESPVFGKEIEMQYVVFFFYDDFIFHKKRPPSCLRPAA